MRRASRRTLAGATVPLAALVTAGGGVQVRTVGCGSSQTVVDVDASIGSSVGDYPPTGGRKTTSTGRTSSKIHSLGCTLTIAS
jgi:hypothetical protein